MIYYANIVYDHDPNLSRLSISRCSSYTCKNQLNSKPIEHTRSFNVGDGSTINPTSFCKSIDFVRSSLNDTTGTAYDFASEDSNFLNSNNIAPQQSGAAVICKRFALRLINYYNCAFYASLASVRPGFA